MTDNIKFPPLPVSANFYGMYGEYTKSQVEALMREAVRLNAHALPAAPQQPLTDEKEALALLNAENTRLTKLVIELRGEVVRLNAQAVPHGLEDRIEAAIQRIVDNHAPRRIPADPTDVDLVLAEVLALIRGKWPPFWIHEAAPAAPQPAAQQEDALDAARYRWLCEHHIVPSPSLWDDGIGFVCKLNGLTRRGTTEKATLDAAIDAAMKGE